MAVPLEKLRSFTRWKDPVSGVASYILTKRAAPMQQSFYFVNPSIAENGAWLWFYCAFPPAGDANYGRTLAVLDVERDTVRHFPETQFLDASPMVDPVTGEVYWCNKYEIWKRSPRPQDQPRRVARFPAGFRTGAVHRIATHLTMSADKKELSFDAEAGNRSYIGSVSLKTGEFSLWQQFDRCYNHAQFHPKDPDLILLAQDSWMDKYTGKTHHSERLPNGKFLRLWTIRRGQPATSIQPKCKSPTHEWWSADGRSIYFMNPAKGTVRFDLKTGKSMLMNPHGRWHGHASGNNAFFVADSMVDKRGKFRGCAFSVVFYNRLTGKKISIVTYAPGLSTPQNPSVYHVDPHPQFACGDRYVVYTTSVLGRMDVAVVRVEDLIAATR